MKTSNKTYENCKLVIENGNFEYGDMQNKLDLFLKLNRITEEQHEELSQMLAKQEVTSE